MTPASGEERLPRESRSVAESSRLLDLRDCERPEFHGIHGEMLEIGLELQPAWFRPLLVRSRRLKSYTGLRSLVPGLGVPVGDPGSESSAASGPDH